MLSNVMLPNVADPVGTTYAVAAATTMQSDEEVKKVSRLQRFSRISSPTPSQEDYIIGPGYLTVFHVAQNANRRPAVFEPIATRVRTTRPREVTQVPVTPAVIGNLAGAIKWNNHVLHKKQQPLTKKGSERK
jgi:hypothetical protein